MVSEAGADEFPVNLKKMIYNVTRDVQKIKGNKDIV